MSTDKFEIYLVRRIEAKMNLEAGFINCKILGYELMVLRQVLKEYLRLKNKAQS